MRRVWLVAAFVVVVGLVLAVRYTPASVKPVPWLLYDLRFGGLGRTYDAARELGRRRDPRAIEPLIRKLDTITAFESGDNLLRMKISEALASIGEPAIEPLIALLKSTALPPARVGAFEVFREVGDRRAFEIIDAHVQHADRGVRVAAIHALRRVPGEDVDDLLLSALASGDRLSMFAAARTLGHRRQTRAVLPLECVQSRA